MTTFTSGPEILNNSLNQEKSLKNDIFAEMKAVGINPDALLEIAAHDLINQYGDKALVYSQTIEQQYYENDDEQSLQIWQRISSYLQSLNGDGSLVAH